MRKFKFLKMLVIAMLLTTLLAACVETIETTFNGTVKASPSTVGNGEEIVLTIVDLDIDLGNVSISSSSEIEINGQNPIKAISYYIDDQWVATSYDEDNKYTATYTVQNLSPGTHTVSAHCEPSSGNVEIHEVIANCQITVK